MNSKSHFMTATLWNLCTDFTEIQGFGLTWHAFALDKSNIGAISTEVFDKMLHVLARKGNTTDHRSDGVARKGEDDHSYYKVVVPVVNSGKVPRTSSIAQKAHLPQ